MTKIPKKLREEMSVDPWYSRCCRCGDPRNVQWHHVFIFKGRQVQGRWAIVPACEDCHTKVKEDRNVKEFFEWIALGRGTESELKEISKVINYFRIKMLLDKKFVKPKDKIIK